MKLFRKLLVVGVVAAALLVPSAASAKVDDSYQGWGTVSAASGNYWAPAWQWYQYYGWWNSYRYDNSRVWIQPFSAGWSWTWTSDRGWLAMRTTDLSDGTAATTDTGATGTVTVRWPVPTIETKRASAGASTALKPRAAASSAGSGCTRPGGQAERSNRSSAALAAGSIWYRLIKRRNTVMVSAAASCSPSSAASRSTTG